MIRRTAPVALAAVVSGALVGAYLLLGGASYRPAAVADPCAPRQMPRPSGLDESVQRILLSAVDGAACSLGASREELLLALRGEAEIRDLAEDHDIDADAVAQAVRDGIVRATDDAERIGTVGEGTAETIRRAAELLPLSLLIAAIRGAASLFT